MAFKEPSPKVQLRRQQATGAHLPGDLRIEGDYTEGQLAVLGAIIRESLEYGRFEHTRASLGELSGTSATVAGNVLKTASEHGIISVEKIEGTALNRIVVTSPVWKANFLEWRRAERKHEKFWAKRRRASKHRP